MEVIHSDQIPQGRTFEVNGILVIGTKKDDDKELKEKNVV